MATATICSVQRSEQAAGWHLSALGISLARIALRRHHIRDVAAGSLLGLAIAHIVIKKMK